ncbi:MAG: FAD-dependent oxidoreductase [Bacteroidota bacterium]
MPTTWYDSKVIKIEDQSPTTKRFWVEIEGVERFDFIAGQFVTMDLPLGEKRKQRWRSYSIANAPDGTNVLEFCIVKLEGGAGSTYFFDQVEIGTPIRFKGPSGTFVLPQNIEKELVLISTGTGVAPYRSMLWDLYNKGEKNHKIHLIFGTRFKEGILYQEEFVELMKKMPNLKYDVALSRETGEMNGLPFPSHRGYVHPIYLDQYSEKDSNLLFLLCGWTAMIDEAVANLVVKMGYGRSQVKYELYG